MKSVELFSGAGGLAMGVQRAGFEHVAVIEWNRHAFDTLAENIERGSLQVRLHSLHQSDVRSISYPTVVNSSVDLISGGPPCQPFSLGGKHRGHEDERDMLPEMVRATRELQPKAVIIENVKGLTRASFSTYLRYILLQLSFPEIIKPEGDSWHDHLHMLERYDAIGLKDGLSYQTQFRVLNAANFGIPQKRERVFIIAFRSDLKMGWHFPEETHSHEALLWSQWVTGEYWDRLRVSSLARPSPSVKHKTKLQQLRWRLFPPLEQPWVTVRDALQGLNDPCVPNDDQHVMNHDFNAGARIYKGHTGSPLDEPAKTLKAGDHGVPGGENMMVLPDGRVRYFTVRESARLQTFPDSFVFHGSWTENMRQLGNAVPVDLAHVIAASVYQTLSRVSESAVLIEA